MFLIGTGGQRKAAVANETEFSNELSSNIKWLGLSERECLP